MFRVAIFVAILTAGVLSRAAADERAAFFERQIRPVLVQHCQSCHSADADRQGKLKGGLRVDSRAGLRNGGDSGPAVVPGDVAASLIVDALRHESFKMPPAGRLPESVVADFERWIRDGAFDPRDETPAATANRTALDIERAGRSHWAFQPLHDAPPVNSRDASAVNPIDLHLAIAPAPGRSPEVDRPTLLRRLSFDLTGLPPTPEEIAAFVQDSEPDAYERLVDRLLASPHYGERWGRHWLDLARYADSSGFHSDLDRPNAWRYRDYAIRSFNDDKPYARFIAEQLAGDELSPATEETLIATGFGCHGPSNDDNMGTGKAKEKYRLDLLDDTLSTTATVFLGLTLGCARCHDHKIDPLTSVDYYRFLAFFAGCERRGIAATKDQKKSGDPLPAIQSFVETGKPRPTFVLRRGNLDFRGDEVQPGVPAVLAGHVAISLREMSLSRTSVDGTKLISRSEMATTTGRRRALAEWLGAPDNALAYRVWANRVWQYHFGRGLVATPSNFGLGGERPTHPELLDWLARKLVTDGSLKSLHRAIVTSAAYRSRDFGGGRSPRRLEAEVIRDAVLSASGCLNPALGGPGIKPRIRPELITTSQRNKWPERTADGPDEWRRSVYIYVKRQLLMPMMELFDSPTTTDSCPQRAASVTPTQALVLMNDEFVEAQAGYLADRVLTESAGDLSRALDRAYVLVLGKSPTPQRREQAERFVTDRAAEYAASVPPAESRRRALADLGHVLFNSSEFVYVE